MHSFGTETADVIRPIVHQRNARCRRQAAEGRLLSGTGGERCGRFERAHTVHDSPLGARSESPSSSCANWIACPSVSGGGGSSAPGSENASSRRHSCAPMLLRALGLVHPVRTMLETTLRAQISSLVQHRPGPLAPSGGVRNRKGVGLTMATLVAIAYPDEGTAEDARRMVQSFRRRSATRAPRGIRPPPLVARARTRACAARCPARPQRSRA